MPIYEYRCNECGKEFEMIQKFSDDPLTECIHCSGSVDKLISKSSFHLKGSGWYATDYGGKGKAPPESDGKSGDKSADKGKDKAQSTGKPECAGCPSSS
ncbi:MAG: FmdB family zinc ribbon protein [Thermodesulfobacteriota bacterium]